MEAVCASTIGPSVEKIVIEKNAMYNVFYYGVYSLLQTELLVPIY